MKETKLTT